jgi:hypothetical protein
MLALTVVTLRHHILAGVKGHPQAEVVLGALQATSAHHQVPAAPFTASEQADGIGFLFRQVG